MIGSTLIAIPYGFSQSGMLLGLGVVLMMGSISCYTCLLVVRHGLDVPDFSDYVRKFFGLRGVYTAMIFSVLVLVGALVAFHILMMQNLHQVVQALLTQFAGDATWTTQTASLAILFVFPACHVKDIAKLVKVNSFGVFFVCIVLLFEVVQGIKAIGSGTVGKDVPIEYTVGVCISYYQHV